ncbi:MAG TPA: tetratricopeptide repeat protein [Chloroflexia bacterium]|nr:tetratricopeptide repeat protein [Chloroflexia bacterium]
MTALINTKLYFPTPRAQLVLRPRLLDRLNEVLRHKLTLVCAPAGFGKTTLLTAWHSRLVSDTAEGALRGSENEVRSGWVALDEADNDPARFFTYFLTALEQLAPGIAAEALLLLQAPQPPALDLILTSLINNLTQLSPLKQSELVCVLDDYHLIENEAIHRALVFLLDHLPSRLHLVILSRSEPPFPMARLRTRAELLELRADQLRFTSTEAARFLQQVMRLPLSEAQVAALEERTEGWIAGLQMAALSLQGREDLEGFIEAFTGSHRYVLDYLAEEVLVQLPQKTQAFLEQTGLLERLTGPLCEAVTGLETGQGQQMLEELEAANLFLVPLDQSREWFRYHHLLGEFLEHRLRRLYPDQIPELHRRASRWFAQAGLNAEAIRHALEGRDFEQAASLIEAITWPMIERGEHVTLHGWLEKLPKQVLYQRPQLCLWYAWSFLFNGQVKAWAEPLSAAEQAWKEAGNEQGLSEVYRLRAHAAWLTGQTALALENARQALDMLPSNAPSLRGSCENILGNSLLMQGSTPEAEQILLKARMDTTQEHSFLARILTENFLAETYLAQDRLDEAEALAHQTLAKLTGRAVWHKAWSYITLGKIYLKQPDWDKAEEWLKQAVELAHQINHQIYLAPVLIGLGRVQAGRGEVEAALTTFEQAAEVARQLGHRPYTEEAKAYQAQLWLEKGDLTRAGNWAESYYRELAQSQQVLTYEYEAANLALAKVWQAQNKTEKAQELLDKLEEVAIEQGRSGSLAEIKVLKQKSEQGEPKVASFPQTANSTFSKNDKPVLIEPLGEREMEILRLIAAGLSNREIAEKLVIAVSTVKWYINTIYGKLEVDTRTKAIARARQLKLVD